MNLSHENQTRFPILAFGKETLMKEMKLPNDINSLCKWQIK